MGAPDQREQNERERSAAEARKTVLQPVQIERYLNPPADTSYSLEYAYNLIGDVRGKTVLDFGCGSGENVIVLGRRGARVIGIDISPDLIALAKNRAQQAEVTADLRIGSAYDTGLPDRSVDVIFCIALIHHLEIPRVQREMARVLREDGYIVLQEPIRFSGMYNRLRKLFPPHPDISDYEHPLTADEFGALTKGYFSGTSTRFFRLPFVPLFDRLFSRVPGPIYHTSNWLISTLPFTELYASIVVTKLRARQDLQSAMKAA